MLSLRHALLALTLSISLIACGGGQTMPNQLLVVGEMKQGTPTGTGASNRFPQVHHALTKSIADSINRDLVAEVFGTEWSEGITIADAIHPTDSGIPPVGDLSYLVIENNARLLALAISGEGCGAYCEPFTLHFNYDATTGRRITIDQLFTGSGLAILADSVTAWKRREIVAFLDELRDDASGGAGDEEEEYVDDMIAMYETCLESLDEYKEELSYADVAIDRGAVTIYLSRCSNHAMRAIDELGDFSYRIDFKRWKVYLTPYGKQLLGV